MDIVSLSSLQNYKGKACRGSYANTGIAENHGQVFGTKSFFRSETYEIDFFRE